MSFLSLSHTAVVACISIGLCVSTGVEYTWSSLTSALAKAVTASPRPMSASSFVPGVKVLRSAPMAKSTVGVVAS